MAFSKLYLTVLSLMFISGLSAQDLSVRIVEVRTEDNMNCVELQLSPLQESSNTLSSQNYRLFYNADEITIVDSMTTLKLPEDVYQLRVVQHVKGIDASGTGDLPFESKLGFLNFSVVHGNLKEQGASLLMRWTPIVGLCYEEAHENAAKIILARESMTKSYGRAYIEISAMNTENALVTTEIKKYQDYEEK